MKNIKNKIITITIFSLFLFLPKIIFAQWDLDDPDIASANLPDPAYGVFGIVANFVYWILGILELISFIAFVIAGLLYLTASGDDDQIKKAKKAMTFSIIGVIVGFSGFVIFQAAQYLLNAMSF